MAIIALFVPGFISFIILGAGISAGVTEDLGSSGVTVRADGGAVAISHAESVVITVGKQRCIIQGGVVTTVASDTMADVMGRVMPKNRGR
jgi:hypothetical protein